MARSRLQSELERRLAPDVHTMACPGAQRVLLLQALSDDLHFGLVIQNAAEHGPALYVVDLGVRIPSVEDVVEDYEEHTMKEMGFPYQSPIGWLTFWTAVEAPTGTKRSFDDPDLILSEFQRLRDEVRRDLDAAADHYHQHLSRCSLPAWATMPGSSFLVIRTLACSAEKRKNLGAFLQSRSDLGSYERNVHKFMDWFSQRKNYTSPH